MRNFRLLLGTCIVGIVALTTSAFAYFNFSSNSSTDTNAKTDKEYVNNIKFDENSTIDPDRVYTLYFFASPYYATGTSDTPSSSEDPLTIAKSSSNPYNVQEEYKVAGATLSDDSTKYANITWTEDSVTYGNYISADVEASDDSTTITPYNKRDFTGYIPYSPNGNASKSASVEFGVNGTEGDDVKSEGINFYKVYSYLKVTVNGGLKQDLLKKIIAQTEFKDKYGFGPEFMGWTYNKAQCFKRATYTANSTTIRYVNSEFGDNYKMYSFDSEGKATSEVIDQIGNFGDTSSIDLLSADDSLYKIDHYGLDGTETSDKIIYLYPVFGDKNEIKDTSTTNVPILKMFTNPDTDETSSTYYKISQKGSVDYDYIGENGETGRYTNYFDYSEQTYTSSTTSALVANYTLKDFYVDMYTTDDNGNNVNHYYLETMLTNDNNEYTNEWITIFDDSILSNLNFSDEYFKTYEGTFDIDIIFVKGTLPFSNFTFKNPQLYINTPSINSVKDSSGNIVAQFAIGIKRDNSLKFTGLTDYNSIFDYNADSGTLHDPYLYKTSYIFDEKGDSSYWHYFVSNPIEITGNDSTSTTSKFSVMIREALSLKDNHDLSQFQGMTTSVLNSYNDYLDETDEINKNHFIKPLNKNETNKKNLKLEVGREDTTTSTETITNFPYLKAVNGYTYEFLVAIKYEDGFPKQFQIAYREYTEVCNLLVLKEKPTSAIDTSGNYVFSTITTNYSSSILLQGEFTIGESITKDTKFGKDKFSTVLNNSTYSSKELYDLATGKKVKDLITSGDFVLSRNMILYYGDSTSS